MYYVWHSENLGATADGREAFDYFPANFSPSLFLKNSGPLSVLIGFSPEALLRTSNGGPMTFELHDTVFKNDDSVKKVAALVHAYIHSGGHQLQINAVNREKMIQAQLHPEDHQDLIVRVWGWSGHFVELDECYQNQIIKRVENVTGGIELAAFTAPKNRYFTLNDKISLFLDSMMKIYDIPENDRKETIDKVISLDCEKIAKEMFDKFVARLDGDRQNEGK